MKLIKANNLKRWADTLEIRGLLSELIRRLVHVTKLHLSKVYIPTEESTHSAGWDGGQPGRYGDPLSVRRKIALSNEGNGRARRLFAVSSLFRGSDSEGSGTDLRL